jgi:hypothetical protein
MVKTDFADIRGFTTDVKRIQSGAYSGIFGIIACHVIPVGRTLNNETVFAVMHTFCTGLG